jgi:hypothetical protein
VRRTTPCAIATTLDASGFNNEFCDTDYDYGACVQYRGEGYVDVTGFNCAGTLSAEGESMCPGGC